MDKAFDNMIITMPKLEDTTSIKTSFDVVHAKFIEFNKKKEKRKKKACVLSAIAF